MSYVTDQVKAFYDDRGFVPVVIGNSSTGYLHSGIGQGILCRSDRQPLASAVAMGNGLLRRQCPKCSRNYISLIVRARIITQNLIELWIGGTK